MKKLKIIGIAGTNGSGKDTVGHTLANRHGYLFVSVTDLLRAELSRRGLPIVRDNTRKLGIEWRHKYGNAVLVDRAVKKYEDLNSDKYSGLAIASLRNPYEADRVHELGGLVVWIDADSETRYKRVQTNAKVRNRAGEDSKTYEEFLAEEAAEMSKPPQGDAATLDMSAVKKRSDIILINDATDLEHFQNFITEQLFSRESAK